MGGTISYLPDLSFIFVTIVFVFILIRTLYKQLSFILLVGFIRADFFQVFFLLFLARLLVLIFPFSNFSNFRLLFLALPREVVVEE